MFSISDFLVFFLLKFSYLTQTIFDLLTYIFTNYTLSRVVSAWRNHAYRMSKMWQMIEECLRAKAFTYRSVLVRLPTCKYHRSVWRLHQISVFKWRCQCFGKDRNHSIKPISDRWQWEKPIGVDRPYWPYQSTWFYFSTIKTSFMSNFH